VDRTLRGSVVRSLNYVYFRMYAWFYRQFGEEDSPEHSAWLATTFMIWLNALTILWLMEGLRKTTAATDVLSNPLLGGALFVGALFVTYVLWYRESKHSGIVESYSAESAAERERGTMFVIVYISLSIILPVVTVVAFM
jgi:apolipoprotein N-acyltransferase